ncbi:GtrA family protein [Demequina soli]|uniref:GtrA family protein n=1 Tax=Demequina soli TaxID=1638987 RepID=UPI0007833F2B|nr:GtrA family protein [Demequina soli]
MTAVWRWVRGRAGELTRFGVVGIVGVLVNLGVFNLLRLGPLSPDAEVAGGVDRVVTAKIIATLASILFAWVAHREWTYRGRSRHRPAREAVLFALINGVALVVEAGVLFVSHHWWGLDTVLDDNLFSLVGIGLGTVTRYVGYGLFVFHPPVDDAARTASSDDGDAAA